MRPVPPFFSSLSVVQVTQSRAVPPSQGDESESLRVASAAGGNLQELERRGETAWFVRQQIVDSVQSGGRVQLPPGTQTTADAGSTRAVYLSAGTIAGCARVKMAKYHACVYLQKRSSPQLIGPGIMTTPGMPLNEPGRCDRWKGHPGRRRTGNRQTAGWPS